MLFGHVQFRFEDDAKPVCQKYSHAKIYPPDIVYFFSFSATFFVSLTIYDNQKKIIQIAKNLFA